MARRPKFLNQMRDPNTDLDFALCTMASGAMALDYHTGGKVPMTGGQLVAKTGLSVKDISDGTNLNDLERAWARVVIERKDPSIVLQVRRNTGWDDVMTALRNGRAVILQGNYNLLPDKFTCQKKPLKGNGGHAILLLPELTGDGIMVGDPLCNAFRPIPEAALRTFAEKFSSPNNVLHANTRAFPPGAPAGPAKKAAVAPAAPLADVLGAIDATVDRPVAVCDLAASPIFADPGGAKGLLPVFPGGSGVGLYSRPKPGSGRTMAAVQVDTRGGPDEELHIGWVADTAVSNVRVR